ncbi:hypothetical protein [Saccharopolyspora hordei]|uniref:Uncharacterized protein n=1 Tax=Saccharopolyspora hordei TaxID=1838 RepID=A0A853ANG4_9PSEU|nr:hypothetical protein [Saccharopolyspora hordei]NYI85745.1 hypothetical protein [Saccharopolyspora hordei]
MTKIAARLREEHRAGRGRPADHRHLRRREVGLWLDTSAQPPEQTVDEVLRRWREAVA